MKLLKFAFYDFDVSNIRIFRTYDRVLVDINSLRTFHPGLNSLILIGEKRSIQR